MTMKKEKNYEKYYYASNSLLQFLWFIKIWDFIKKFSFFGIKYDKYFYKVYINGSFNFMHKKPCEPMIMTTKIVGELDSKEKNITEIFKKNLASWENNYDKSCDAFFHYEFFIYAIPVQKHKEEHTHGQYFIRFFDNYLKRFF